MSHHLDTPLASQTGQLFLDDLYVFPGQNSTVFVMDVNSNITGVYAEPGFHPEARYEFKVHFDGADEENLTYRVSFSEADGDGRQALGRLGDLSAVAVAPDGKTVVTAGVSGAICLWDTEARPARRNFVLLFPPGHPVAGLAFSPDRRHLATGNPDGSVYVLRLAARGSSSALPDPPP